MSDMKQFEQFAEIMQAMMPQVKANKNGYEIRTKVLEMAQEHTWQDFHAKWGAYESKVVRDPNTGEIVTSIATPEIPNADAVLDAANKFYEFVSNGKTNRE
jgi:hypothetical protein